MSDSIIHLKQCKNCQQEFPATTEHFTRDKSRKDGLNRLCKKCNQQKVAQWLASHPGKSQEYLLRHYEKNTEKIRQRSAEWRKQNWEQYYQSTKQRTIERVREWVKKNPDRRKQNCHKSRHNPAVLAKHRVYKQRYRARKRALPDSMSQEDWLRCLEYFNHCCAVCGRQLRDLFGTHTVAADHWIPLNSPDCPGTIAGNIIPLCHGQGGCNNRKHDLDPEQWLIAQYGKRKAAEILKRIESYFEWIKHQ